MIMRALSFWKTRLDESRKETVESEEDQKKEAAKAQADEEQAEIDAAEEDAGDADADTAEDTSEDTEDTEDTGSDDAEDTGDADADTAEDTGDDDGFGFDSDTAFDPAIGDEGGMEDDTGSDTEDDTGDDDGEDGGDEDDSAEEDDDADVDDDDEDDSAEEGDEDDDGESEFKLEITAPSKKLLDAIPDLCKKFGSKVSITVAGLDPEGDDEEGGYVTAIECQDEETLNAVKEEDAVKEAVGGMDGELNESLQYEPNTVGAVIKLLSQSDPRDFLFIRLAPNMKQCMIYDIDRKVMVKGQSTTYLEIAIGDPNK